ncbi:hypothetical protein JCM6882_006277, partial [Rhodosporidiobolus microsporus]
MPPPLPSLLIPFSSRTSRGSSLDRYDIEEREPLSTVSTSTSGSDLGHSKELDASLLLRPHHSGSSPRQRSRHHHPLLRRVKEHAWVLVAFVLGCLVGHAAWRGRAREAPSSVAHDVREGVWAEYGGEGKTALGTKVVKPEGMPECERTLLFDWARFPYGFGSTATSLLQAAFFARANNYTMLFSRGANGYGAYLDHFTPAPLSCWPQEEHYDPQWYLKPEVEGSTIHAYHIVKDMQDQVKPRTDVDRVIVDLDDLYPLNWFVKNQTYDFGMLDSLPDMSATTPLSPADNVPSLFRQRFLQYSAVAREHLLLNPLMQARVGELVRKYGLDLERDVPTVGIHFRGGDKLATECRPSSKLSCGNVTLHCQTALSSLSSIAHLYPSFDADALSASPSPAPAKPRILLMTAEPDALARFKADAVCQRFEIVELPRRGGDKPFLQAEWKQLSELDRLEDTR